jgi:peptidoglycan/LPS O-acetylase OafA/YrhL
MHPQGTPDRAAYLDGWRGLAILLVLLEHFADVRLGRAGVDTFFALSGLLMGKLLFADQVPLGTFYKNRIARIFPVFYLYLLLLAVGTMLLTQIDWASFAGSALFVRSYWPEGHIWEDPMPIGNLWSLNVEEHAYVLLSVLALLSRWKNERMVRWLLALLPVLCLGFYGLYRYLPDQGGTSHDLRTECAAFPLLLSAALFVWRSAAKPAFSARSTCVVLCLTVILVLVDAFAPPARGGHILKFVLVPGLLALSVNMLDRAPPGVLNALSNRVLTWLGLRSFSIYIWHYPFFYLADHWDHWFQWSATASLAGLTASLLISAVSYRFYEQPMRQWVRGLGQTHGNARLAENRSGGKRGENNVEGGGAGGRTRTGTVSLPGDFESPASTNFATPAKESSLNEEVVTDHR